MQKPIYIVLSLLGVLANMNAQMATDSEIFKTLKANDSLIFERSFNHCETQYLSQLIAKDFEFYHDISGLETSKTRFIESIKNGICNPDIATTSRRELIDGSLEVFPLQNDGVIYAALQNGIHRFFETTNDKEVPGSTAKFSHLWIIEDGKWYLKRVISYDHQMP
ncbi:nuclear transport factor 2 family protein [Psychroserpens mesophilus]|uniref:nuclear transport factor 2 family protein n=1 Tax=Psychroserpens mesophilus TaxID=325473 RepID=UPI003D6553D4